MTALLRPVRPSELTAEHIGLVVQATEAGGLADGGLSDFQHCSPDWAKANPALGKTLRIPELEREASCPSHPPRTDAHTHLWLGGKTVTLSEARGRVAVSVPIEPATGLPFPGETP